MGNRGVGYKYTAHSTYIKVISSIKGLRIQTERNKKIARERSQKRDVVVAWRRDVIERLTRHTRPGRQTGNKTVRAQTTILQGS